jgi:hypothetical protein
MPQSVHEVGPMGRVHGTLNLEGQYDNAPGAPSVLAQDMIR